MPRTVNGVGTRHFGQSRYVEHKATGEEEFDTTLWFSILWLPIIPLKSYRIRQRAWPDDVPFGLIWRFQIIENHHLDWRQIGKTYLVYMSLPLLIVTSWIIGMILESQSRLTR